MDHKTVNHKLVGTLYKFVSCHIWEEWDGIGELSRAHIHVDLLPVVEAQADVQAREKAQRGPLVHPRSGEVSQAQVHSGSAALCQDTRQQGAHQALTGGGTALYHFRPHLGFCGQQEAAQRSYCPLQDGKGGLAMASLSQDAHHMVGGCGQILTYFCGIKTAVLYKLKLSSYSRTHHRCRKFSIHNTLNL